MSKEIRRTCIPLRVSGCRVEDCGCPRVSGRVSRQRTNPRKQKQQRQEKKHDGIRPEATEASKAEKAKKQMKWTEKNQNETKRSKLTFPFQNSMRSSVDISWHIQALRDLILDPWRWDVTSWSDISTWHVLLPLILGPDTYALVAPWGPTQEIKTTRESFDENGNRPPENRQFQEEICHCDH